MSSTALNYDYQIQRLALGVEFEDALNNGELVYPVRAEIERESPHQSPAPKRFYAFKQMGKQVPYGLLRHGSGRYSLTYHPGIQEQLDFRVFDYDRYYIPRRFRVPLLSISDVLTIEENEVTDYFTGRIRRLFMFPGSAYHSHSQVTGIRGRVMRDGVPMRWAFIEAIDLVSHDIVTRTRGDDRGEFLLILPPHAVQASDLSAAFDVRITIAGPAIVPVPATTELPSQDNFWDLPLEELPPVGMLDTVSNGKSYPTGYVNALSAERTVSFEIGRVLTGREEADFEFSLP